MRAQEEKGGRVGRAVESLSGWYLWVALVHEVSSFFCLFFFYYITVSVCIKWRGPSLRKCRGHFPCVTSITYMHISVYSSALICHSFCPNDLSSIQLWERDKFYWKYMHLNTSYYKEHSQASLRRSLKVWFEFSLAWLKSSENKKGLCGQLSSEQDWGGGRLGNFYPSIHPLVLEGHIFGFFLFAISHAVICCYSASRWLKCV